MHLTGERQIAPTVAGIRTDHVNRYLWAAEVLPAQSRVVDFACGVGYGTKILAEAGHVATGYDKAPEVIGYARTYYPGPDYQVADDRCPADFDAAVCFETIEHLQDPATLLKSFSGRLLLASVPNESAIPFNKEHFPFHHRHYTKAQFTELLNRCGWIVREWWGQKRKRMPKVGRNINGRTLIALASR